MVSSFVFVFSDVGVATDEGLELFFTWHGVRHTFSSFISGNFIRYVVTLFLDLFISNPFQDILKRQARATGIMEAMSDSKHPNKWIRKWDGLLSKKLSTTRNMFPAQACGHKNVLLCLFTVFQSFSKHGYIS